MHTEEERMQERNGKIFIVLCLLWIPYIVFFMYWLSVDATLLSQMVLTALVLPAVFQPFFWYLMLGCFLAIFTRMYGDKL